VPWAKVLHVIGIYAVSYGSNSSITSQLREHLEKLCLAMVATVSLIYDVDRIVKFMLLHNFVREFEVARELFRFLRSYVEKLSECAVTSSARLPSAWFPIQAK
jgi:hypothetical protein